MICSAAGNARWPGLKSSRAFPIWEFSRIVSSGASILNRGIKPAELGARVGRRELPVDPLGLRVAARRPCGDLPVHRVPVGEPLAQALALEHAQLEFGHVQPGAVL